MAVSIYDLLTPLDATEVTSDLIDIGAALGLQIQKLPGEPGYQLVSTVATWGTRLWNRYGIPALAAQFYNTATGQWLTLRARADGVDRFEETFAGGVVTLENRSSNFWDLSAIGAIKIENGNGFTFTSQGPPTGSTGTLAVWSGSGPYPQTTLTFTADQAGSASNTPSNSLAGYPTTPASAPPGVYVVPTHGPLLGSDGESDPALVTRGRLAITRLMAQPGKLAYVAAALDPVGTLARYGIPVPSTWGTSAPAIARVAVVPAGNSTLNIWLASASGPAAGNVSTPDTDVYKANVAIQFIAAAGMTVNVSAATAHAVNVGTITLYIDRGTNVTQAEALASAQAALANFFSTLSIGGQRITPGGQGYVFASRVAALCYGRGVVDVGMTFTDVALATNEIAIPTYTVQAVLVTQ